MPISPRARVLLVAALLFAGLAALVWYLNAAYGTRPVTPLPPPSNGASIEAVASPTPTTSTTPLTTETPAALPSPTGATPPQSQGQPGAARRSFLLSQHLRRPLPPLCLSPSRA